MEIVKMEPRHVAEIAVLEKSCFSEPWSENAIASELDNPLSLWLVAEENGHVAGYIGSQTVLDMSDMMNVAVAPDRRQQGIGRRLIETLIARLDQRGAGALSLEVRVSNQPAIRLYEQLGFEKVGQRKNYYVNPKEDAWIMRKQWKELEM